MQTEMDSNHNVVYKIFVIGNLRIGNKLLKVCRLSYFFFFAYIYVNVHRKLNGTYIITLKIIRLVNLQSIGKTSRQKFGKIKQFLQHKSKYISIYLKENTNGGRKLS